MIKSDNFTAVTVNQIAIAINPGKDIRLLALKQMIRLCASHIPEKDYVLSRNLSNDAQYFLKNHESILFARYQPEESFI